MVWKMTVPSYNSSAVSFHCIKTKQKHCDHIVICQCDAMLCEEKTAFGTDGTSGQMRTCCGYESSLLSWLHSIVICLCAPGKVIHYRVSGTASTNHVGKCDWHKFVPTQLSFTRTNVSPQLQRRRRGGEKDFTEPSTWLHVVWNFREGF